MKLSARHIRIAILMILSQVLITGFSLYWLNGQFREERKSLRALLTIQYKASQQVVIDSMLVEQYITPALGDSTIENRRAFITIKMASDEDSSGIITESKLKNLEREMLLRSVKLIIQHVDDTILVRNGSFHGVGHKLDSMLFITNYESGLIREGINLNPGWVTVPDDSANHMANGRIMVIGDWSDSLPQALIHSYRPYLFSQLIPQTLFALIMILMTGSAFILAYKSLRKQMVLNEMRSNFISNISHELKTPVSTVKVALEALRNFDLKNDPVVAEDYLKMASKEIIRLELLITKVLDNSIIEQDSSIIRFEKVDLDDMIKGAIDSFSPRINKANGLVRFSPPGPQIVYADPLYFQGVMINLFDNSLKYGNGNPEIDIELSADNGNAIIKVSDNGPGIPEEFQKKVFEKFFRLPTNDTHNVKGYGLGLSFASLIIGMHNGTIEVKNNRTGCTFTIKIPKVNS